MAYQKNGLTSLHEVFADLVIYRNLIPADPRIPAAGKIQQRLGLKVGAIPRKAEPVYAQIVAEMLCNARRIEVPRGTIRRLLYIGDTQMNDGIAFRNLCAAGEWPGWAFIGRDDLRYPPQAQIEGSLYLSNRWAALEEFVRMVEEQGFVLDEETAVVVDVDKTAIGARGRNDKVIDQARVEGVQRTVADLLGPQFDPGAFQVAYDELNQPRYHAFTADNQDYLAYMCLMLGTGMLDLSTLLADMRAGTMRSFADLIGHIQDRRSELAATGLTSIHDDVWARVQEGDPTPFKTFRYNEYLTTTARFGDLPGATVEQVLAQCIVVTQEVRETAAHLRAQGALLFGLSDKPDEASFPNEEQARAGMKPLHRITTLSVGSC